MYQGKRFQWWCLKKCHTSLTQHKNRVELREKRMFQKLQKDIKNWLGVMGQATTTQAFSVTSSSLREIALKIHPVIYLHSAWQAGLPHSAIRFYCALSLSLSFKLLHAHSNTHMDRIAGCTYIKIREQNHTLDCMTQILQQNKKRQE